MWRKKHNALPPKDGSKSRQAVKGDDPPLPVNYDERWISSKIGQLHVPHVGWNDTIRSSLPAAAVRFNGRAGRDVGHCRHCGRHRARYLNRSAIC